MSKIIFKRKIYSKILQWKNENNGKSALLIEGPRRVGKSTIVEEFVKNEYKSYIIIDFNKASQDVKSLFDDLMDLDLLFLYLQTVYHVSLHPRESAIVFDEVQSCPKARQAIKYLVEDGRYDYIETGSLISIKKNTESITIPSEEDRIYMNPMDFEEFMWATGNTNLFQMLGKFWNNKIDLSQIHRSIMRDFRLYMLVGGMPQAVVAYLESNDFTAVDKTKRRIVNLYKDDFLKIDPSGKTSDLFFSIPGQLSTKATRFYTNAVIGPQNDQKIIDLIHTLSESRTVNVCYKCNDPNIGMNLHKDSAEYKLFIADTGLFITMAYWDKNYTDNIIYQKLLSDKLPANLGYIYENMVAQILISLGFELFYYTWIKDDKHHYEIDFLISEGFKISPIEVKSSGYKTHTSLDEFLRKFSSRIYHSYMVSPKEYSKKDGIFYIPPYFLPFALT